MAFIALSDLAQLAQVDPAVAAQPSQQVPTPEGLPPTIAGYPTTYVILGVGAIGIIALAVALKKKKPKAPEWGGYPPYGYQPMYGYQQPWQHYAPPPAPQQAAPQPSAPQHTAPQQAGPPPVTAPESGSAPATMAPVSVAKNRPRKSR